MKAHLPELPALMIEAQVRAALEEDLGRAGDITSQATIRPDMRATCMANVRENGVISGLELARTAFRLADPTIEFEALVSDGDRVMPGTAIARISGRGRSVLSGERVALSEVLMVGGQGDLRLGSPTVEGAVVHAVIEGEDKGPKLRIFKHRRRKRYRLHKGHRQHYTRIRIDSIEV